MRKNAWIVPSQPFAVLLALVAILAAAARADDHEIAVAEADVEDCADLPAPC